jgi:chaperone modulatory protein CbpM
MIDERALCARFARLELATLRRWVEEGWVRPRRQSDLLVFDEADVARVALLCDLAFDIEIEERSLPVVLSLLDQVYDLRRQMGALAQAISALPTDARGMVRARLRQAGPPGEAPAVWGSEEG